MQRTKAEAATPSQELARAVSSLLQVDPSRISALAETLRGPDRVLESIVKGMSMGHALPPGSRIRIELADHARYDNGDVVAILVGSQVVVHRIVHCGKTGAASKYVITRGDAPLVPDPPVRRTQILGVVSAVWRDGNWGRLGSAEPRRLPARIMAFLLVCVSTSMLYLSARVTAALLTRLHRLEGAVRAARVHLQGSRGPLPPRAG